MFELDQWCSVEESECRMIDIGKAQSSAGDRPSEPLPIAHGLKMVLNTSSDFSSAECCPALPATWRPCLKSISTRSRHVERRVASPIRRPLGN